MASKIIPKRRGLIKPSAPKKDSINKEGKEVVNPLMIKPQEESMSTRIQTAEGWKREQLKRRSERRE